jgi:TPR repeat protein
MKKPNLWVSFQQKAKNWAKLVRIALSLLTTQTLAAKDIVNVDAADNDNSDMQVFMTNEGFYLDKLKNNLGFIEKDQALASLGTIYLKKKEYAKALKYLKMVGHSWEIYKTNPVISAASYNLGMIYINGKGIPKDYPKAFDAFARATWAGNREASRELYIMCRDKEAREEQILDFIEKNSEYVEQGAEHELFESASLNLSLIQQCIDYHNPSNANETN